MKEYIKNCTDLTLKEKYEAATPEIMLAEIAKLETFELFGDEYISTMTGAVKKAEIIGLDFDFCDCQLNRYQIITRGGAKFDVLLSMD